MEQFLPRELFVCEKLKKKMQRRETGAKTEQQVWKDVTQKENLEINLEL
jgi:hypothetical protein